VLGVDGGTSGRRRLRRALARLDRGGRAVWPSLFAYQYVAVLRRDPAFGLLEEPPSRRAPRPEASVEEGPVLRGPG